MLVLLGLQERRGQLELEVNLALLDNLAILVPLVKPVSEAMRV